MFKRIPDPFFTHCSCIWTQGCRYSGVWLGRTDFPVNISPLDLKHGSCDLSRGYISLVDLLGLFSLNHHDLNVKIPHPAVTQVVVDAQPTYCVEVELTMNTCGSHSVLEPLDLGAFLGPLCCMHLGIILCQVRGFYCLCRVERHCQCECAWSPFYVGFGVPFLCCVEPYSPESSRIP